MFNRLTNSLYLDKPTVAWELRKVNQKALPYFAVDALANNLRQKGQPTAVVERRARLAMEMYRQDKPFAMELED